MFTIGRRLKGDFLHPNIYERLLAKPWNGGRRGEGKRRFTRYVHGSMMLRSKMYERRIFRSKMYGSRMFRSKMYGSRTYRIRTYMSRMYRNII